MCPRLLSFVFVLLSTIAVWAQSAPPPADSGHVPSMQMLLDRIQQLEKRVSELEANQREKPPQAGGTDLQLGPVSSHQSASATQIGKLQPVVYKSTSSSTAAKEAVAENSGPAPAQTNASQPQPPPAVHDMESHQAVPTPAVREAEIHYPSLQFRGFGDVDFFATDQKGTTTPNSGFSLGQFDLHLASPLSEKVSYFGEVTFTAQPITNTYDLTVERTIIRYDYNDHAKISFGKYHTPIGYWNTAFHHGAWLQTTVSRPEMVAFGTTFIPLHFVGLEMEGSIPSGGLGLNYNVGLGNGRSSFLSKAGDNSDSNNNRAWVAGLFARPTRFYGLQFGASVYRDKLSPQTGPNFREWITSAHLVWAKEHPEFISEFANVHHRSVVTGQVFNSQAFYAQLAYRLAAK
jgi:hypothetical protein